MPIRRGMGNSDEEACLSTPKSPAISYRYSYVFFLPIHPCGAVIMLLYFRFHVLPKLMIINVKASY